MSTINTNTDRRSFLKISAAVGGGLVLGFNWAGCKQPQDILVMPEEWIDINAYLKIGENGVVTIMSPNPEIGQNVKTSMPMLIAEELDVNWDNVVVEQGALDPVKYGGRQIAGGSQSIRHGWTGLRTAGATARYMLLAAAAKQWEVPIGELTTADGTISHAGSGKSIGYGAIASAAAQIESPNSMTNKIKEAAASMWSAKAEEVTIEEDNLKFGEEVSTMQEIADKAGLQMPPTIKLKDQKDFKIIGTDRLNVDGKKLIVGEPLFGLDTKREGMLIAGVIHPPAFGMKVASIDASVAKNMAGIKDVFVINTMPEGVSKQWSDVNAFDELVAVVGESTWQVFKAKKAVEVTWEETSKLENSSDHDATMLSLVNAPIKDAARKDGNPNAAFAKADKVVESIYSAPFLAHNTMEPMNFFADVSGDKAELHGPVQTPIFLRGTVAKVCGLKEENVHVMMTRMGGGFGRRLYGHFGTEAAVISQKMGTPINLVYTREDDMTQGTYRPSYKVKYKAGLDADGQLLAFEISGAGTNERSLVFANRFPAGAVDNYQAVSHNLESNISTGAWRAPRSNFIACAEQSFLDEVAEAAGKDPIDFRIGLFDRADNSPVGTNNDYDAKRYAGVLKLVKNMASWGEDRPGVHRGVSAYYCHNTYVAQVVDVAFENGSPKVKNVFCAVDCGIVVNPIAAKNQLEGGIVDGIGHAMYSSLKFENGVPNHKNYDTYRLIRHREAPEEIQIEFVDNGIDPTGLGEPSLPPIQAALANALYKATGKRLYEQPFNQQGELLG